MVLQAKGRGGGEGKQRRVSKGKLASLTTDPASRTYQAQADKECLGLQKEEARDVNAAAHLRRGVVGIGGRASTQQAAAGQAQKIVPPTR